MGLNNNGLGFTFFGKDDGLSKQQKESKKGFEGINSSVSLLKKTLGGLGSMFAAGVPLVASLGLDALHGAVADVQNITTQFGNLLHGGVQLTSSLETNLNASRIELRKMAVQAGFAGDAVEEFADQNANLAYQLGLSATQVGQAAQVFSRSGEDLAAAGIDSVKSLAQISETLNVSPDLFEGPVRKLRKELGLTDAQTKSLVSRLTGVGRALGDVPAVLSTLPDVVSNLEHLSAMSGNLLDPARLVDFAKQIQATTVAYAKSTGATAAESAAFSQTLTQDLLGARDAYQGLFAGVEDDLSGFVLNLGIGTGDVHKIMAEMQAGPEHLMTSLAKMYQSAVKQSKGDQAKLTNGLNFIRQHVLKAMDPAQADRFMQVLGKLNDRGLQAMANIGKAERDLSAMGAEGMKNRFTAQQQFDRLNEQFDDYIKKAGDGQSKSKEFLKNFGVALKRTQSQISALAKGNGPLSTLANLFLDVGRFGALAVVPEKWRGLGAAIGKVSTTLAPMIGQLNGVFDLFNQINPLMHPFNTLVVSIAGLVLWFKQLVSEGYKVDDALDKIVNTLSNGINTGIDFVADLFEGMTKGVEQTDKSNLWGKIGGAFSRLWENVKPHAKRLWDEFFAFSKKTFETMWIDVIQPILEVMWDKFSAWFLPKVTQFVKDVAVSIARGILPSSFFDDSSEAHDKQFKKGLDAQKERVAKKKKEDDEFQRHAGLGGAPGFSMLPGPDVPKVPGMMLLPEPATPNPSINMLESGAGVKQGVVASGINGAGSTAQPLIPSTTAAAAKLDDLETAAHEPDWYTKGYEQLFTQKMDEVREAVTNSRPSLGVQRHIPQIPKRPSYSEGGTGSRLPADMSGLPRSSP